MTKIKTRWADQQDWNNPTDEGHFHNVLDCCSIKAITGWHVGKVADGKTSNKTHFIIDYGGSWSFFTRF